MNAREIIALVWAAGALGMLVWLLVTHRSRRDWLRDRVNADFGAETNRATVAALYLFEAAIWFVIPFAALMMHSEDDK